MTQNSAYARGGDDKRRYDCCAGDKIGNALACDQGYCADNDGGTDVSSCNDHMQTYCQVLRSQYPKKNGVLQPRTGPNSLTSDLQALTPTSDLSMYTWLSDDYKGCACWDSDYADFVKQQQKVVIRTSDGTQISNNYPENLMCWFTPCVNSISRISWLNPSCPSIQVCIQYQNNQISAGGHVNIASSTIDNQQICNQESTTGGSGAVLTSGTGGGGDSSGSSGSGSSGSGSPPPPSSVDIKLYLLIGGGVLLLLLVLLLFAGGADEKGPDAANVSELSTSSQKEIQWERKRDTVPSSGQVLGRGGGVGASEGDLN